MSDISYINWYAMTDKALAQHIGHFVKQKRIEQNKTQAFLSHAAGISRSTLSLLEKGQTVSLSSLLQVLRVLEQLHVLEVFNIQTVVSPLLLAELEAKKRKRASKNKNANNALDVNW